MATCEYIDILKSAHVKYLGHVSQLKDGEKDAFLCDPRSGEVSSSCVLNVCLIDGFGK